MGFIDVFRACIHRICAQIFGEIFVENKAKFAEKMRATSYEYMLLNQAKTSN